MYFQKNARLKRPNHASVHHGLTGVAAARFIESSELLVDETGVPVE